MDFINSQLLSLIPPAILISVLAYLVRFFGKIIADQKPFADDRGWEIEISGTGFFLVIIFDVVLGTAGALRFGDFGIGHLIRLIITTTLGLWLLIIETFFVEKIYQIKYPFIKELVKLATRGEIDFKGVSNKFLSINYSLAAGIIPIIFAYILTIEYKSGSLLWMILNGSQVFLGFILLALNYSLNKTRLPKIDIFFTNGKTPVRNAILLKYNKDNIRIKQKERVVIVNRDFVQKIELLPTEKTNSDWKTR